MCTAATYKTKDFYFGRTLDYEFSYGEEIVVVPRNFPLDFKYLPAKHEHFAVIGTAHVSAGYPLFYDAVNEKGLCVAGLNFVGNAVYRENKPEKTNIAQYEFILWLLSSFENLAEAKKALENLNITNDAFGAFPPASLHWIISDKTGAVTLESVSDGVKIYDNPVGVLTNNPPFDIQMSVLNNYMGLSPRQPENGFSKDLPLKTYSRGMGALGLPGDLSSMSRFARVAFTKMNSVSGDSEDESVGQFFHILGSVDQQRGCCEVGEGKYEITIYTSCCNADKGIYYYTTYGNRRITAVDMHREDLDKKEIIRYPMITGEDILRQN